MKNIKLEVVRYSNDDVIATSGHYQLTGMTETSYQLSVFASNGEVCNWDLINSGITGNGGAFTYLDENGTTVNADLNQNGWVADLEGGINDTGKWFHYNGTTYVLCDDITHHDPD